ncbi:hypothetical protein ELQ88_10850 [Pseudomonas sp. MPC6]|nr:hypothetical protein ELQ88_10850 [Pseudomonas sp. MPC6]
MLAMDVNDNACLLVKRGALESIASKLAPTAKAAPRSQALTGAWQSRSTTPPETPQTPPDK